MAWEPNKELVSGLLDNTTPGVITGFIELQPTRGKTLHIPVELQGDFLADICSTKIKLRQNARLSPREHYLDRAPERIVGVVGDITAGIRDPLTRRRILGKTVQVEWFDQNGAQWLFELERAQMHVVGTRGWRFLTGDDEVDHLLIDMANSYAYQITDFSGRPAVKLLRRNGVRELTILPPDVIERADAVAREYGIGQPRMNAYTRAA